MKPSEIFSHWEQVRTELLTTIDMFKQDELTFTPFKGSWSIGKIILHIADCENYWLHGIVRHEIALGTYYDLGNHPTTTAIKEALESTRKRTIAFLDSLEEHDLDKLYTTPHGEQF